MTALSASLPRGVAGAWRSVVSIGLLGGVVAIYLGLVGIVPVFNRQSIVAGVITLGEAAVFLAPLVAGYLASRRAGSTRQIVLFATFAGALTGLMVTLLVVVGPVLNLRTFSQHATPTLWNLLTLDYYNEVWGPLVPTLLGAAMGLGASIIALLPAPVRRSLLLAALAVAVLGLFSGVLRTPLLGSPYSWAGRELFAVAGLSVYGAVVTLSGAIGVGVGGAIGERLGYRGGGSIGGAISGVVLAFLGGQLLNTLTGPELRTADALAIGAAVGGLLGMFGGGYLGALIQRQAHRQRVDERLAALPTRQRRLVLAPFFAVAFLFVLALPHGLGPFFAQVVALVVLYMMMAFGLNITLGMAGLLDLGFVAFFAVGAYTVGILTSAGPLGLGIAPFSEPGGWWFAVPLAVLFAFLFGAFLGLPVLGIRGDYLAIATLGFGEIIRILAGSDLLRNVTGGAQGIALIPRPISVAPDHILAGPTQIYYIALAGAAVIAFLSLRLRDSRLGRAWLAIREDEDVAEALGINLVQTKLLAYSLGAAFAGLGGAVFAGLVGSVFNTSINLFVSINIAAIIIIGGMGSIPGVVVGAVFLIGLPELFREFSEYRFLFYGAALILMMRFRPEGILPSRVIKRELHVEEENVELAEATVGESIGAPGGAQYPPESSAAEEQPTRHQLRGEENIEPADGVSPPAWDKQQHRGPKGR